MKYSSVIFDWDGTLGMTLHLWIEGYTSELKKLGFTFSNEVIVEDFFYEHDKSAVKYPDIDFEYLVQQARKYVFDHVSSLETYPDAFSVLEKLQNNNIALTLVSSSTRKLLKKGLEEVGLNKFFSVMVSADDIMRFKPDPEAFNQVIEIAKLNPKNTIILGDSHNDIIAAKAAGIDSCLFLPEENKIFYNFDKLKKTNPIYCVKSLNDFVEIILDTE